MFDENDLTVGPLAGEQFALPRLEGPVDLGKAQETAMSHVGIGDYGNIRTIEFVQPDGTIARLRTRGGYPVFETDAPTPVTSTARGFVAKVPAGRAVLFNPYTLTILNSDYKPAGKNYTVQDFATSWGVPAGDTTHWHDVVLSDGSVKINTKTYSPFGSFGTLSETEIPHIINRADDYDQYGNVELNLMQKRYFEVERESVKTWGGAGSVSLLTPQAPITDAIRRAMTVGPRVDFPTDTAWLAEFYSSSVIWDDPGASWLYSTAAVQMLLTSAYLVKTSSTANVDMPIPSFSSTGASSGNEIISIGYLPSVEIGLVAHGRERLTVPYSSPSNHGIYQVDYPVSGTFSRPLAGEASADYTRTGYTGSATSTETQSGKTLNHSATNTLTLDIRTESYRVAAQTITVADHDIYGLSNSNGGHMGSNATTLWWGDDVSPGGLEATLPATRGRPTVVIQYAEPISGSLVYDRNYHRQSGTFQVSCDLGTLVSLQLWRDRSSGQGAVFNPVTGYYAAYLADPTGWINSSGMGLTTGPVTLDAYIRPSDNFLPIGELYKVTAGSQDPSAIADINAKYEAKRNEFMSMTLYENENSDAIFNRTHYTATVVSSLNIDLATVAWDTVDYILCDEQNGVFITVEAHFSGEQTHPANGTATLTVTLKVVTRYNETVQMLETLPISYGELLPEKEVLAGIYGFPSPQIRAIFTPLYREQGSFKGAHYVTAAEEIAGAIPFHGFNFRLRLTSYDAVGSVNTLNKGETVYLVPCNLLEMLYATVFSSELGVADDGSRYPVTRPASYNAVMNSLFTNAYRVAVRDGVAGNWTDAFGTDFAETSTISLHRT